ncbi:hypothetical protein AOB57_012450 [Methanosarcina flavescens]|uniref:Uncharacterized protein n=1 Tax=Methanosarcina flavescens TaxID=1715806 RepID=A0A660HUF9_9EURY|nr:hypothetical protein AOB57_012450 [Methanosarcina flavescens]
MPVTSKYTKKSCLLWYCVRTAFPNSVIILLLKISQHDQFKIGEQSLKQDFSWNLPPEGGMDSVFQKTSPLKNNTGSIL